MTSSACICEPGFRARIKKMQTAYQNAWEFFQKIMGEALVPGFGKKQPLQKLKFWLFWFFLFYIKLAGNNEPCRVTPLHLVDNTDTQYLGDQHWQQCWFFRFFFLFVSICLSMCQSVCVSVYLFTINLKFLKTHNYWLAQLVYVSQVSGLELKKGRLHIKMLGNSSKKSWERH